MQDPSDLGPNDVPNKKTYPLANGTVITAHRTDPFGFWHLELDKGTLPEKFKGSYTSTHEIERAIKDYLHVLQAEKDVIELSRALKESANTRRLKHDA